MDDRDIVDEIDALVDEQLKQEKSGYDHNINQEYCPHCGRHWHGLPLTSRVAEMYAAGEYYAQYSVDSDHSMVVCPGSTAPGPLTPAQKAAWAAANPTYGRGYAAVDHFILDEAYHWAAAETTHQKRCMKRILSWAAVWAAASAAVWLTPGLWSLLGVPVQWFALWKVIRPGRRKRTIDDDFTSAETSDLGPDWTRVYRGTGFGLQRCPGHALGPRGARRMAVRAVPVAWRSDDGT